MIKSWFILILGTIGLCAGFAMITLGCAAAKPAAEVTYTAERLKCIDDAKTATEAKVCDQAVKAKWGTLDGGAQ